MGRRAARLLGAGALALAACAGGTTPLAYPYPERNLAGRDSVALHPIVDLRQDRHLDGTLAPSVPVAVHTALRRELEGSGRLHHVRPPKEAGRSGLEVRSELLELRTVGAPGGPLEGFAGLRVTISNTVSGASCRERLAGRATANASPGRDAAEARSAAAAAALRVALRGLSPLLDCAASPVE